MDQGKRAVALGFFDGVHRGHAALLERVKQRASELQAEATVLTFDVHPDTLVFGKEVPLINSAPEREEIIRRLYGIEHTVFLHFNRSMMTMPWQEFLSSAVDELKIAAVVVGHDFSFGYRGEGKPDRLKAWCGERGISCDVIPAVCVDDPRRLRGRTRGQLDGDPPPDRRRRHRGGKPPPGASPYAV